MRHSMAPTATSRRRQSSLGGGAHRGSLGYDRNDDVGVGRRSMGTGRRGSRGSGAAGGGGRQSISRRSSAYGQAAIKDPRPIKDRQYMNQSIRGLISFLTQCNYDHAISPKLLTHPTGKDFLNIVTFLFRLVDPNFKMQSKMVDEVPIVFKGLGYPFGISKTALSAVGSPHTWPALLASLSWLIELLDYDQEASEAKDEEYREHGSAAEEMFFEYLRSAYDSFLSGDDDAYTALEQELVDNFSGRNVTVEKEIAALREQNRALKAEAEQLESAGSAVPALRQTRADYRSDLGKFDKLISQLQAHLKALNAKREGRREEQRLAQAELESAEQRRAGVRSLLDEQELSEDDVRRMASKRERLRADVDAAQKRREEDERSLATLEQQLQEQLAVTRERVEEYAAKARALKLGSGDLAADMMDNDNDNGVGGGAGAGDAGAEIAGEFSIRVVGDGSEERGGGKILSVDAKRVVRPVLKELLGQYQVRIINARAELLESRQQEQDARDALAENEEERQQLQARVRKAEDLLRREKESGEKQAKQQSEEMEGYETRIAELRDTPNDGGASSDRALVKIEARIEAERSRLRARNERLHNNIIEAVQILTTHKVWMQERLGEVKTSALARAAQLKKECDGATIA